MLKSEKPRILIVDDESSIRKTLSGILRDEGFETFAAGDGAEAFTLLKENRPNVVLLDIWMPGMDGLEVLARIKQTYPDLPVIMISGHADIATAVKATRMGAVDFIEKPLDLNFTLQAVRRAAGGSAGAAPEDPEERPGEGSDERTELAARSWDIADLKRVAFEDQKWRGRRIPQRTLARTGILYGQGLHSGRKSGLSLEPLPANSGIHFAGLSGTTLVPAHVDFVGNTGFATTLRFGDTQAGTTEHLMSALHAYGISNLLIKCNGEVPVLDGSAQQFCALFDEIGLTEQEGDWYEIEIRKSIEVGKGKERLRIEPADDFTVDYTLSYPEPVGLQRYTFTAGNLKRYKDEIAPARTFGFVKDISNLHKAGLALGGRFDNFVLIGEGGAINDSLRFSDEPVRHKVLDALGDLYLLGRPIRGRVVASMTGHSDNIALLRAIREEMSRGD